MLNLMLERYAVNYMNKIDSADLELLLRFSLGLVGSRRYPQLGLYELGHEKFTRKVSGLDVYVHGRNNSANFFMGCPSCDPT